MIKHFIVTAFRNILRKRTLSFIQIFGLALGITAFLLIAKYVQYEKNWDKFNTYSDRIYRVQLYKKTDALDVDTQTSPPVSTYISQNISDVEEAITIKEVWGEYLSPNPEATFYEPNGFFAPSEIFSIFSIDLIEGDLENVLDPPNAIVLSESMAKKYFPKSNNYVGKIILDNQKKELVITGIMKDLPEYSHIRPDYLRSITEIMKYDTNWGNDSYKNYVLLKPHISAQKIDAQIKYLYDEHTELNKYYLFLHPLGKLHLEPDRSGDLSAVVFFNSLIGILILVLALVNFMNLSTAFSSTRSVEIGIRKTNGSSRKSIAFQFLFESMFLATIAFILAVGLSFICLPYFNHIVDREITLSLTNDFTILLFVFLIIILSSIISSAYPAILASRFNPIKVLKGKNLIQGKKGYVSGMKAMVYIQFVLSAILIATSLWSFKQVQYLQNKSLGFNKDQLLHTRMDANQSNWSYQTLREELLAKPGLNNVTISSNSPLHSNWGTGVFYENGPTDEYRHVNFNYACPDFIDTYQITLLDGRNFSKDFSADDNGCLINETAVMKFGWKDPIGKWIELHDKKLNVIGVVKDFHQGDVHNLIQPFVLMLHDGNMNQLNDYTFQINQNTRQASVDHIKSVFNEAFPNSLYQIFDFEDDADRTEIKIWSSARDTFGFFACIAILIAIVGIFGLIVFATQRKVKEIGIRKVQGATIFQVFRLFIKEYMVLLILANICIYPVFPTLVEYTPGAYKYHASILDILIVITITIMVVLVSSGYLAYKAASRNPVEALRYE